MTSIARENLTTPSTWLGPELLATQDDWIRGPTTAQISDLDRALATAKASGKTMAELTRDDFPLPVLAPAIAEWMESLQNGRDFINVKGIPVAQHSGEDIGLIHWGLGLRLGTAVSQNAAGDVVGHVRDTGADPNDTSVRLYKTRVDLGFHSDGSDLPLSRRETDLLLYPVVHPQSPAPSSGAETYARTNGAARPDQRDCRRPGLPCRNAVRARRDQLSQEQRRAARTEYKDFDEPARMRHLVRLWLTAHDEWADGDAFVQQGIPAKKGVVSDADEFARAADGRAD